MIAWLPGLGRGGCLARLGCRLFATGDPLWGQCPFYLPIFNAEIAERGAEHAEKKFGPSAGLICVTSVAGSGLRALARVGILLGVLCVLGGLRVEKDRCGGARAMAG